MTGDSAARPLRVFMLGGTGTIGRATIRALAQRGHHVVCFIRPKVSAGKPSGQDEQGSFPPGVIIRYGDVTSPASLMQAGLRGERFDVLISCLASRTGAPEDAWAIDYHAHMHALAAVKEAGVRHMVLLSAICVQKPLLAFQHAKLAFEKALIESGLSYSIVRPTAFFKSLSGQVERVRKGKPFLLFGDGCLTACKPISDADLAAYLVDCLEDESLKNRILPIGGPGPAITPKEQGEHLFALLGREPKFRHVPVALLDGIIRTLSLLGKVIPVCAQKAELARIGRYYSTESMLVLDPATGSYNADLTPSTGHDTLFEYYARLVRGEDAAERGAHAVF
jgi:divinyl chlorophyllide a 8-vinyl-reductase